MARRNRPIERYAKQSITNKVRESEKHKGSHPHHYSSHSGSRISNPNVVHHHKIEGGSKEHVTHIHHQQSKLNTHTEDGHNPNQLPHSKLIPAPTGTKGPLHPKTPVGKTPLPNKQQPVTKVPVNKNPPHVTSNNSANSGSYISPSTQAAIEQQIQQANDSTNAYNKAHPLNQATLDANKHHSVTSGVYTPQVSDYSNAYTSPMNSTSPPPLVQWWNNTVKSIKNWIFPGNPYY